MSAIMFVIVAIVAILFVFKTVKLVISDYLVNTVKKRKYRKHGFSVYHADKKDKAAALKKEYAVVY
jgi:hypothetical protein